MWETCREFCWVMGITGPNTKRLWHWSKEGYWGQSKRGHGKWRNSCAIFTQYFNYVKLLRNYCARVAPRNPEKQGKESAWQPALYGNYCVDCVTIAQLLHLFPWPLLLWPQYPCYKTSSLWLAHWITKGAQVLATETKSGSTLCETDWSPLALCPLWLLGQLVCIGLHKFCISKGQILWEADDSWCNGAKKVAKMQEASEEGKSCEKPKDFCSVGPKYVGNFASEKRNSCDKLKILGAMGPKKVEIL